MNPPDDDFADMGMIRDQSGNGGTGAVWGADTAAVTTFLTELRTMGEGPAPEPSPELAALLAGATPLRGPDRAAGPRHWRKAVIAAAAATLVGGSAAAATGRLPQPAQRFVSNVVDTLTPFSIPSDHVTHPANPTPKAPVPPVEEPSRTGADDSGKSGDDRGGGRDDGSGREGRDDGAPVPASTPSRSTSEPADDGAESGGAGAGSGSWSEGGGSDDASPSPSPMQSRQSVHEGGADRTEHREQQGSD